MKDNIDSSLRNGAGFCEIKDNEHLQIIDIIYPNNPTIYHDLKFYISVFIKNKNTNEIYHYLYNQYGENNEYSDLNIIPINKNIHNKNFNYKFKNKPNLQIIDIIYPNNTEILEKVKYSTTVYFKNMDYPHLLYSKLYNIHGKSLCQDDDYDIIIDQPILKSLITGNTL